MIRNNPTIIELWKQNMTDDVNIEEFILKFENELRDDFINIEKWQKALPFLESERKTNTIKAIKITEIFLEGMFKLEILGDKRKRIVEEYISELIRKKLKESNCVCFRIGLDGRIEVFFRFNQNEWTIVEGNEILPCSFHMLANTKWDNALKELEDLINSVQTKEHDLQKFFEVYPELLSDKEFDTIIPQAVICPDLTSYDWKADFVLSPFNQFEFAKIIELKLPSIKTTKIKKPEHISFTSQIWHSIQQVKDYAYAFDKTDIRNKFRETYRVDIFKPDMHLIIGRSWDVTQIDTIKKMKKDSQVKIETWDEVLTRLKRQYS